jgi:hypothetical protein
MASAKTLAQSPGHLFYERLNRVLGELGSRRRRNGGEVILLGRLALIGVAVLILSGTARALVLCTTPDGKTYVGDTPPPGCEVKSSYESAPEAPAPNNAANAPVGAREDNFSVQASRARTKIERALNKDAGSLEDIRKRIGEVELIEPQGSPNYFATQQDVADAAAFQSRKAAALKELSDAERKTLADMADLWRAFDELDADVVKHYGGKEPDWWRHTLSCPGCPSRYEIENALK